MPITPLNPQRTLSPLFIRLQPGDYVIRVDVWPPTTNVLPVDYVVEAGPRPLGAAEQQEVEHWILQLPQASQYQIRIGALQYHPDYQDNARRAATALAWMKPDP